MVTVAVAGGTGGVGRTLVDAILASGKHDLKILSRKANPELEAELKTPIIAVDYADVEGLARVLEENNVHTVISALNMAQLGDNVPREPELIRAADASKTTKRMISSDWGPPLTGERITQLPSGPPKVAALAELQKVTNLETTIVQCSFFLDNWGSSKVKTHMSTLTVAVDIANRTAAIPGSGDVPAIFTHTRDLARFVTLLLDQEKWDPVTYVTGDHLTLNEFVRLAEEVTGEKFTVTYDSLEKLKKGEATELPSHVALYPYFPKQALQPMVSIFGAWFEEGVANFNVDKTLNDQFPEVKVWSVKDFLQDAWGA
ncbi:uncharacterized protein DNG_09068 [Cephalotrichum gorgonifer]|uniref:NmrA-like domain-containing protein n=1 Tax=Cephalotrichum gorgonifer TaxID=2041049 RepID=A0AAE8N6M2_9PEZI|nr:uncharacterized protein DNG_09068 [Cephalotrichum gorgonifer]